MPNKVDSSLSDPALKTRTLVCSDAEIPESQESTNDYCFPAAMPLSSDNKTRKRKTTRKAKVQGGGGDGVKRHQIMKNRSKDKMTAKTEAKGENKKSRVMRVRQSSKGSAALDPGTRVYACWIDGSKHSGEWYPGKVVGHRIVKKGSNKGERVYHVKFDDGDERRSLEDYFVMEIDQYLAMTRNAHDNEGISREVSSEEVDPKETSTTQGRKNEEAKLTKLPRKKVTPSKRISVTEAVSAPSYEPGDAIYACTLEKNECSGFWYPGTVKNVAIIDQGPDAGFLQCDVEFDDGRAGARLKEDCIMARPHNRSNQVESQGVENKASGSLHTPGSRVIACWRTERGDCSGTWFPGTVEGSRLVNHGPRKGKRFYRIKFDDGRVDKSLDGAYIMAPINDSMDEDDKIPFKDAVESKVLSCWHTEEGFCTGRWYPSTIKDFTVTHGTDGKAHLKCTVVYQDGSMNEDLDYKYVMGQPIKKFCARHKHDVSQGMKQDSGMLPPSKEAFVAGDIENKIYQRDEETPGKIRTRPKRLVNLSLDLKNAKELLIEKNRSTRINGTVGKEALPSKTNSITTKEGAKEDKEVVLEKEGREAGRAGSNQIIKMKAETAAKKDSKELHVETCKDTSSSQEDQTGDEKVSSDRGSDNGTPSEHQGNEQEEVKEDPAKKGTSLPSLIGVEEISGECAPSTQSSKEMREDFLSPSAYETSLDLQSPPVDPPVPRVTCRTPPHPPFPSSIEVCPTSYGIPYATNQFQTSSCVAFDNIYSVALSEPGVLGLLFEETEDGGTIITQVAPNTQADHAGIKVGDIVCAAVGNGRGIYPCSAFQSVCTGDERPIKFNILRQSVAPADPEELHHPPYYPASFNPYNDCIPYAGSQYQYPQHYVPHWTHAPYSVTTPSPLVQEAPNASKISGKKKKKTKLKTPQDFKAQKARKYAQSRARAAKLKDRIEEVKRKCSEERTVEEEQLLAKFEEQRSRKNLRAMQRSVEKKQEIERILAIPEKERTKHEKIVLDTAMKAKQRKNEGDRIRRERMKMLGFKVKPEGVTVHGRSKRTPVNVPLSPPLLLTADQTNRSGLQGPSLPPFPAATLLFPDESGGTLEMI